MPRITVVTNRCNLCRKTHRPGPDDDDSDKLDSGVEDTDLPLFWTEVTLRSKQANPDFAKNEKRIERTIKQQWSMAAQQAAQAKGSPLDSDDVEGLREILDQQARGDTEYPELVVVEAEIILCETCTPRLADVGLVLTELTANGTLPPAWAPAAAPAPVAVAPTMAPPPSAAPTPQPSPPLAIAPQVAADEPPPSAA